MSGLKDSLSLNQFNSRLRELHTKARDGKLESGDRDAYEQCRGDLARMLVFAQQLTRRPGETFRQALRVPLALDVKLEIAANKVEQAVTIDLSTGGFAAFLAESRAVGETLGYTLRLPDDVLAGRGRVVASTPSPKGFRVSFALQNVTPADLERLEMATFDWVLANLGLGHMK